MKTTLDEITSQIVRHKGEQKRCLVAIAGPPGSGKSTLAEQLDLSLNKQGVKACMMPMDGFHLDDSILIARGHKPRKGAEHTFDAYGFVDTVARIHTNTQTVYAPVFDRDREIAIAGAQEIAAEHSVVLIEGNYLLLRQQPWAQLSKYFTLKFFLNPGIAVIEKRILERWQDAKLDEEIINQRTYENDLPNANYVLKHSSLENTTVCSQWS